MSAEIGILNKTGVVLAADSAATVTHKQIVKNHATKIYSVSPKLPLGIMVFNVGSWMGIPFEIIIPSYKTFLGERDFEKTEDYVNDFIKFLRNEYILKKQIEDVKDFIEYRTYALIEEIKDALLIKKKFKIDNEEIIVKTIEDEKELETEIFKEILKEILKEDYEYKLLPEFNKYTYQHFKDEFSKIVDPILDNFYKANRLKRIAIITTNIYKILHLELTHSFSTIEDYSGLVFAGYGKDEIFPTIIELRLGEVIGEKLRFEIKEGFSITHENSAIIAPFAQREVIDMYIRGIDSNLLNNTENTYSEVFSNLEKELLDKTKLKKTKIQPILQKALKEIVSKNNKYSIEKHIKPTIKALTLMRRDEMIEIAESLINLTALKRKTSLETESVGGPIDVAFITKAEGFVWMKKK